jgi:hypothetical protein
LDIRKNHGKHLQETLVKKNNPSLGNGVQLGQFTQFFFFLTGISLQKSVTFLRRKPGFIEAGLSAENRDVPPLMIVPAVAV